MQLRYDDAFRAVDDERAINRHQGQFAHVDFLLLHFLDNWFRWRFFVKNDQTNLGAQWRRVGQTPLLTFLDIERRIAEHIG